MSLLVTFLSPNIQSFHPSSMKSGGRGIYALKINKIMSQRVILGITAASSKMSNFCVLVSYNDNMDFSVFLTMNCITERGFICAQANSPNCFKTNSATKWLQPWKIITTLRNTWLQIPSRKSQGNVFYPFGGLLLTCGSCSIHGPPHNVLTAMLKYLIIIEPTERISFTQILKWLITQHRWLMGKH